ncbi:hypothetical protein JNUCC1_03067 [Lentibacillus sp. JNUCC-1]|uniref:hypothetical protein n=1 Tax=Lentibacillus sp. JNUCC-1 TaxID=2654513 RepID=UPI0012E70920|nr:hypothetical protein [Lentibacillus sp. JNUCC-1]MUV39194.1 hypothetical protein [Lentibacillus sp. JNUCC-1]
MIDIKYFDKRVKEEANKYKRLFETFTVNPGASRINSHDYFLVNYYRWGKITGCAVVSSNSKADKIEYTAAFDELVEFATLFSSVLEVEERARANMDAFITLEKFLTNVLRGGVTLHDEDKSEYQYSLKRIHSILNLQDRLKEIYNTTAKKQEQYHNGSIEVISREDIQEAARSLGEVDFIQYRQVLAIHELIPKLKYIKNMENEQLIRFKTSAVKRYLVEFSKGENEQLKNVKKIEFQSNMQSLTKEQHIQGALKDFYKNLSHANRRFRKDLRYPEI